MIEPKTKAVAIINQSMQIGEYEWDTWKECLVCSDDTTIGEIKECVKQRTGPILTNNSCEIIFAGTTDEQN